MNVPNINVPNINPKRSGASGARIYSKLAPEISGAPAPSWLENNCDKISIFFQSEKIWLDDKEIQFLIAASYNMTSHVYT